MTLYRNRRPRRVASRQERRLVRQLAAAAVRDVVLDAEGPLTLDEIACRAGVTRRVARRELRERAVGPTRWAPLPDA